MYPRLLANPYNASPTNRIGLDILMMLVIVAFIVAGVYVGYHYSQDADSIVAHGIETPTAVAGPGFGYAPPSLPVHAYQHL